MSAATITVMVTTPRILGVMQNQWFHDPERFRKAIAHAKDPEQYRRRLIAWALFAGCKSGRVLQKVLGAALCEYIVWEEASREIGGHASAAFPADTGHLRSVIVEQSPRIVIGFGVIACDGLRSVLREFSDPPTFIEAPHPAARGPDTLPRLMRARDAVALAIADGVRLG